MVDDVVFMIMSGDESRETPVVIKRLALDSKFYICHYRSHQNAFGRNANGFDTRGGAIEFAENHGCMVVRWCCVNQPVALITPLIGQPHRSG